MLETSDSECLQKIAQLDYAAVASSSGTSPRRMDFRGEGVVPGMVDSCFYGAGARGLVPLQAIIYDREGGLGVYDPRASTWYSRVKSKFDSKICRNSSSFWVSWKRVRPKNWLIVSTVSSVD